MSNRETSRGVSEAYKKEAEMTKNKFPTGWDEEKVQRVLTHYEGQTEEGALLEDEVGVEPPQTSPNAGPRRRVVSGQVAFSSVIPVKIRNLFY